MFLAATTLISAIGTVFVERYLNIGFDERHSMMQAEAKVLDVDATSPPHTLIVGLDGTCKLDKLLTCRGIRTWMIQVACLDNWLNAIDLQHFFGVGKQEVGIRLEVNESSITEKLTVSLQEVCAREALRNLLHLWVGEC